MFFYCLLSASEKFFLSLRRKEKIKFSRNGICFLLLLIQQKQTASEVCVFTGHVLLTTSHELKKRLLKAFGLLKQLRLAYTDPAALRLWTERGCWGWEFKVVLELCVRKAALWRSASEFFLPVYIEIYANITWSIPLGIDNAHSNGGNELIPKEPVFFPRLFWHPEELRFLQWYSKHSTYRQVMDLKTDVPFCAFLSLVPPRVGAQVSSGLPVPRPHSGQGVRWFYAS